MPRLEAAQLRYDDRGPLTRLLALRLIYLEHAAGWLADGRTIDQGAPLERTCYYLEAAVLMLEACAPDTRLECSMQHGVRY